MGYFRLPGTPNELDLSRFRVAALTTVRSPLPLTPLPAMMAPSGGGGDVALTERKITYTQDPRTGAWFGWMPPDWQEWRDRMTEREAVTSEELLAASLRYIRDRYDRRRVEAWTTPPQPSDGRTWPRRRQ